MIILVAGLTAPLAAVWTVPTFVTQDGPAHLYNAQVLLKSLGTDSPFRDVFTVRWKPLPNWAGHLTLMGLVAILPPREADRIMTSLTLVALVLGVVWLRKCVAGRDGMPAAVLLAVLLGMNMTWLLGFTSFLLGAALFPVTLAVWWRLRQTERPWRRALALASLMTLGYFCHLVSLGLTAIGLVVLEACTPGPRRFARAASSAVGLLPLGPLGLLYLGLMRSGGGGISPEWKHLDSPLSPRAWGKQLSWVDPISIARRDALPFLDGMFSKGFALGTPVVWLVAALLLLGVATSFRNRRRSSDLRGWWVLSALLLIGGAAAPDTMGPTHGEYLQQRIVLLGLVAMVPILPFGVERSRWKQAAMIALTGAFVLQTAMVWDYARTSERTAGSIARAVKFVGTKQRVIMMLSAIPRRFRAEPLLHADGLLGMGTANILWNNYETRYYYFPVRFREGLDHPDTVELEKIALSEEPDRVERWAALLERYQEITDVVIVWGRDPALDAVTERWFQRTDQVGAVRVYRPRKGKIGGKGASGETHPKIDDPYFCILRANR